MDPPPLRLCRDCLRKGSDDSDRCPHCGSPRTISLEAAGGTRYGASQTELDLPTQLSATFTAGFVPVGIYSVVVTNADGLAATLPGAFTMDEGGAFDFHANLVVPSTLGLTSMS